MSDTLDQIVSWYESQCDGDWEHVHGVEIGTLDNPGWFLKIDLAGTSLEGAPFVEVDDLNAGPEWIHCRVVEGRFEGYGGPRRLEELLRVFLRWAREHDAAR